MMKIVLLSTAVTLLLAMSAGAENAPNTKVPRSKATTTTRTTKVTTTRVALPSESSEPRLSSTDVLPGMAVMGADQQLIGTVLQAGETPDGIRAVSIVMDGKRTVLDLSELRLSGTVLISETTKAEIVAKASRAMSTQ